MSAVGFELAVWVREDPHVQLQEKNASEKKKEKKAVVLWSRETCTTNEMVHMIHVACL